MQTVPISILNGTVYGLLLFMLSSGLTLIFGMMGVLNFAHASLYMLGAYFAYQLSVWIGFWPALILAPLIVAAIGGATEYFGLRSVHSRGHVAELLLTFGLAYIIGELVKLIWGRIGVPYNVPAVLEFSLFSVSGNVFPAYRGFMAAVSIGMFVALWILLKRTRIGLIIQASRAHPDMVAMLGHNVPAVYTLVFAVGSALAGLAGVIGGNYLNTDPGMAESLGSIIFVVVVVGGIGSLAGAFVASLLIGIIQDTAVSVDTSLAQLWPASATIGGPSSLWSQISQISLAQIAPLLPYFLLVLILIVRPRGLLGPRET